MGDLGASSFCNTTQREYALRDALGHDLFDRSYRSRKKSSPLPSGERDTATLADRTHKLIRRYAVIDAAVHNKLNGLLHQDNTSQDVFGDSAYRSAANETILKARGFSAAAAASMCAPRVAIRCRRPKRRRTGRRAASARIEHVFGAQETAPGGRLVGTIGIVRAWIKIGLQNLAYNMRRLATLERTRSLASFNVAERLAAA
jgi:IS5 family transposase